MNKIMNREYNHKYKRNLMLKNYDLCQKYTKYIKKTILSSNIMYV